MKVQAIQGREERQRRREARRQRREERRERGDAWWQKLGAAAKKVAPPLVAARAAMLALVSTNFNGLADKMASAQPDRARDKWESFGGEWSKMEQAIRKGRGSVQGIGVVPLVLPSIVALANSGAPVTPGAPPAKQGLGGLWKIALPILAPILKLLGIDLAPVAPTMRQLADDAEAAGGDVDQFDAGVPPVRSGGGAGMGNTALLLGGVVVAAVLLSGKRK
jgi:hypothetical protein